MNITPLARTLNNAPSHIPVAPAGDAGAWRTFAQIPDLINGAPDHFGYIHVSSGIPAPYHWPDADTMAQFGPANNAESLRRSVLKEASVYLCRFAAANLFGNGAERVSAAIHLAWCRAVGRRAWGFSQIDLVPTETFALAAGVFTADALAPVAGDGPNLTQAMLTAAIAELEVYYDQNAADYLPLLATVAMGTPVANGVTLIFTNVHHFVDPHKNVHRAIASQKFGDPMRWPAACGLSLDVAEDIVFHKAFHPVNSARLAYIARSRDIKNRLVSVGLSAAVVRCPAEFQPERAVSAFKAIIKQVNEMAETYNVGIDVDAVSDELDALAMGATVSAAAIVQMEANVSAWLTGRGAGIAWCAGFMRELGTDASGVSMSILKSHAIKRVAEENALHAAQGAEHVRTFKRWQRDNAQSGALPGASLFGAPMPSVRMAARPNQVP